MVERQALGPDTNFLGGSSLSLFTHTQSGPPFCSCFSCMVLKEASYQEALSNTVTHNHWVTPHAVTARLSTSPAREPATLTSTYPTKPALKAFLCNTKSFTFSWLSLFCAVLRSVPMRCSANLIRWLSKPLKLMISCPHKFLSPQLSPKVLK